MEGVEWSGVSFTVGDTVNLETFCWLQSSNAIPWSYPSGLLKCDSCSQMRPTFAAVFGRDGYTTSFVAFECSPEAEDIFCYRSGLCSETTNL